MIEVWAVTAAVGIYSANKASKSAKQQSQFEAQTAKEMVPLQGFEDRKNIQFESDVNERNLQKERSRKAKTFAGLARQTNPNIPRDYKFMEVEMPNAPSLGSPTDQMAGTTTAGLSGGEAPVVQYQSY